MKRTRLTAAQVRKLLDRQGGKCGNGCGTVLVEKPRNFIDEHLRALGRGGSNALKNRALWCIQCSKAKTFGNGATTLGSDLGEIAKTKRLIRKRTKPKTRLYKWTSRPLKGSKKRWPKRGFYRPIEHAKS